MSTEPSDIERLDKMAEAAFLASSTGSLMVLSARAAEWLSGRETEYVAALERMARSLGLPEDAHLTMRTRVAIHYGSGVFGSIAEDGQPFLFQSDDLAQHFAPPPEA